jgi:ribosomal protein S18 acetylase RimI-like enzyme
MKTHDTHFNNFLLSNDKKKMELNYVYNILCTPEEHSNGLPPERLPLVVKHSVCFGAYDEGKQVGFARVVTDFSEFASLWDVFISPEYRKKGIGTALTQMIISTPELRPVYRWFLMTEDAHGLYEKFNFRRENFNPYLMMRINDVPLK